MMITAQKEEGVAQIEQSCLGQITAEEDGGSDSAGVALAWYRPGSDVDITRKSLYLNEKERLPTGKCVFNFPDRLESKGCE